MAGGEGVRGSRGEDSGLCVENLEQEEAMGQRSNQRVVLGVAGHALQRNLGALQLQTQHEHLRSAQCSAGEIDEARVRGAAIPGCTSPGLLV